jgi:hypothetical protein
MLKTVDCTALVTAVIWRAAQDAGSDKKWSAEARIWLGDDGLVLAESIGFDSRVIRRWLADPAPHRQTRRFNLIESICA